MKPCKDCIYRRPISSNATEKVCHYLLALGGHGTVTQSTATNTHQGGEPMESPCKNCRQIEYGQRCYMDGVKRCKAWDEWFVRVWNEIRRQYETNNRPDTPKP